jgi:retron-type reverse transcriptase
MPTAAHTAFTRSVGMNTVNDLWEKVIAFENVYAAYHAAIRGKRYRREVLEFKYGLEDHLCSIIEQLKADTYQPAMTRCFWITDPKKRLISAPAFRDRVVHHALCQAIEPIFEKRFINESFACRVGKGTHTAMEHMVDCVCRAKRHWGHYWVLKCDIHSFFPSVHHDTLQHLIGRAIRDTRVLHLISIMIRAHESPDKDDWGIPIGALTSQLFANIYLDTLDHYLKEVCQVPYYARYMDDFVVLHRDKGVLQSLLCRIEDYLHDKLLLNLNPKTGIFPGKQGIDFCGYRIWPTHVKPRKSTIKRAKKRLHKMALLYRTNPVILEHAKASLQSFLGYIKHCSGWRTTQSILKTATFKPTTEQSHDR